MGFLGFVALIVVIWLLWNISRNTADALDKQTALQYEIVALEKRLDELTEVLKSSQSEKENTSASLAAPPADEIVNINTASVNALTHLPKIGKATAQRIVEGRPFSSVEDIKNIQGISDDIFEALKNQIAV